MAHHDDAADPTTPPAAWRAVAPTLVSTWLTLLAVVAFELVYVAGTYAGALPAGPRQLGAFGLQAIVTASVLALPIAAGRLGFRWLSARLARVRWLRASGPAHGLLGLALLVLAFTLVHCEPGGFAAPRLDRSWLLVLGPGAAFAAAAWLLRRVSTPRADAALLAGLAALYVARVLVLVSGRNPRGAFGLVDRHGVLKTWLAIAVALCFALLAAGLARRPASRRGAAVRWGAAAVLFLAVHHANARLYVDSYAEFHEGLTVAGLALALALVEPAAAAWVRRWRGERAWLACGAVVGGALGVFALRVPSVAHYVGAVHTVYQRFVLEAAHHRLPAWTAAALPDLDAPASPAPEAPGSPEAPASPAPPASAARPALGGVVLIFLDAKRPASLGPYGAAGATPRLDALFRDASVFTRAYASSNATDVSFPGIYAGRPAAARARPATNLVEVLGAAGFTTTVVMNQWYADHLLLPARQATFGAFGARAVADEAAARPTPALARAFAAAPRVPRAGRFLLVVHALEHGADARDLAELDALVGQVGDALRAAGRLDDTLLLLTADHGVARREHGRTDYGHTLFDEELRVPLLVRVPGLAGRRVDAPVSALDHLPTLAEALLGRRLGPDVVDGRSYLPLLRGEAAPAGRVLFAVSSSGRSTAAIRGELKLIHWRDTDAYGLFDLARDPGERVNLVEEDGHRRALAELAAALAGFERTLAP